MDSGFCFRSDSRFWFCKCFDGLEPASGDSVARPGRVQSGSGAWSTCDCERLRTAGLRNTALMVLSTNDPCPGFLTDCELGLDLVVRAGVEYQASAFLKTGRDPFRD